MSCHSPALTHLHRYCHGCSRYQGAGTSSLSVWAGAPAALPGRLALAPAGDPGVCRCSRLLPGGRSLSRGRTCKYSARAAADGQRFKIKRLIGRARAAPARTRACAGSQRRLVTVSSWERCHLPFGGQNTACATGRGCADLFLQTARQSSQGRQKSTFKKNKYSLAIKTNLTFMPTPMADSSAGQRKPVIHLNCLCRQRPRLRFKNALGFAFLQLL